VTRSTWYEAHGFEFGGCGHRHRSPEAAAKCVRGDRLVCKVELTWAPEVGAFKRYSRPAETLTVTA